jgi:hypothetical protein
MKFIIVTKSFLFVMVFGYSISSYLKQVNREVTKSLRTLSKNTTNSTEVEPSPSFSYTYAEDKNEKPVVDNSTNVTMISPEIVDRLKKPLTPTNSTADDVKDKDLYYDGKEKFLENMDYDCASLTKNPSSCMSDSHCGWCKDSEACVKGSKNGPVGKDCSRDNFKFAAPARTSDPFKKKIEEGNARTRDSNDLIFRKKSNY